MIKYDNEYYKNVIKKYNYEKISSFLNISDEEARNKWICSYNLDKFIKGMVSGENSLIIMGIGINGVPHLGTISQILKAIFLQKKGYNVQIILGDLDVYGARSTPLEKINKLTEKYKKFIIDLGFDNTRGIIRNQYDYPEILRTSFLLASSIRDSDFEEIEEDINSLYKTERVYNGMDFNVKQSISLMFADFIHPGFKNKYRNILIISGIDEHGYVWKANEIKERMNIKLNISGLYSKMLRGINDYPKMSKSLINSNINLEIDKNDLKKIINNEKNNYDSSENSFIFQLMMSVSFYNESELSIIKKHCDNKDDKWDEYVNSYYNDLVKICNLWR